MTILQTKKRAADETIIQAQDSVPTPYKKVKGETAQLSAWLNRKSSFFSPLPLEQEANQSKEVSTTQSTSPRDIEFIHSSTSESQNAIYKDALPSKDDLGIRIFQYQLGKAALTAGELAKAMGWFNLAALPRAFDEQMPAEKQLRINAEQKAQAVKNEIIECEAQKLAKETQPVAVCSMK